MDLRLEEASKKWMEAGTEQQGRFDRLRCETLFEGRMSMYTDIYTAEREMSLNVSNIHREVKQDLLARSVGGGSESVTGRLVTTIRGGLGRLADLARSASSAVRSWYAGESDPHQECC
jgi:hypothetical protein